MSLDTWTSPAETDVSILTSMFQNLVQNKLTHDGHPLLYHVAVSHIKHLLAGGETTDKQLESFKKFLLTEIEKNIVIKQILEIKIVS